MSDYYVNCHENDLISGMQASTCLKISKNIIKQLIITNDFYFLYKLKCSEALNTSKFKLYTTLNVIYTFNFEKTFMTYNNVLIINTGCFILYISKP